MRDFFPFRLWLTLAGATLSVPLWAAPVPSMFTVIVPQSDPQRAAQEAMRQVLVRLTGSRDAASDPALAGLVSDAPHYVQIERNTTARSTQVSFDAAALRDAVSSAGRNVWNLDRPLLWIAVPANLADGDELRARLNAVAQARGIPLVVATAADVPDEAAALAAARRAGASAALVAQAGADTGSLQWSLSAVGLSGQWSGTPELAIDGAVDALVRAQREVDSTPLSDFDCHIANVADLPSFTSVLAAFGAAPGVADVSVESITADDLTLHLKARGTPAALQRALGGERIEATGAENDGAIAYRYQGGS